MNKWKSSKLGDFITLQRGFDITQNEMIEGNIPVVSSGGISGYHDQAMVKGPGVITGRKGTLGKVFYLEGDYWPHDTTLWVKDFKGNYPRFVYYFLNTLDFLSMDVGSSNPTLNRNHVHLIPISYPPIHEQRTIAHILGTLDEKIELNRRMSIELEATARAIFQSWFVDFDPVRAKMRGDQPLAMDAEIAALFPDELGESALGDIPSGWDVAALDEIAHYLNGLALQNYPPEGDEYLPVIKIRELRQGYSDTNSDKATPYIPSEYVIQDGDVIFSWSGSLLLDFWCDGLGALNQHLFKVTSANYPRWFYYFWTLYHLEDFQRIAAGKATTMGHIQRKHLSAALTVIPTENVMMCADKIISPLSDSIIANRMQSRTLAELRDVLLPKLVSGQLRVVEVEGIIEEIME